MYRSIGTRRSNEVSDVLVSLHPPNRFFWGAAIWGLPAM
jgi:hypothetical protein